MPLKAIWTNYGMIVDCGTDSFSISLTFLIISLLLDTRYNISSTEGNEGRIGEWLGGFYTQAKEVTRIK